MTGHRYRWLTLGHTYRYQAAVGKGDDSRRGQTCVAEVLPKPGTRPANVQVRFPDGVTHVVPAGVLKAVSA